MSDVEHPRVRAFLDVIAYAEGTDPNMSGGGYNVVVGGGRFSDYSRHPNRRMRLVIKGKVVYSTAAGRYQFIFPTWQSLPSSIRAQGFGPRAQDLGAVELIRRRGGLAYVKAGNFAAAVNAVKKEWASLPGAGYGQHERSFSDLLAKYAAAVVRHGGGGIAGSVIPDGAIGGAVDLPIPDGAIGGAVNVPVPDGAIGGEVLVLPPPEVPGGGSGSSGGASPSPRTPAATERERRNKQLAGYLATGAAVFGGLMLLSVFREE